MKTLRFAPLVIALLIAAALVFPRPAKSYLSQYAGSQGNMNRARWDFSDFPVRWSFNPTAASNVSGGPPLQEVVAASFAPGSPAPNPAFLVSRGADTQASAPAF